MDPGLAEPVAVVPSAALGDTFDSGHRRSESGGNRWAVHPNSGVDAPLCTPPCFYFLMFYLIKLARTGEPDERLTVRFEPADLTYLETISELLGVRIP